MSAKTNNIYGKISITDKTIAKFVSNVALDCYGIVGFTSKNVWDSLFDFVMFGKNVKGVKVHSAGDRIFIEMSVNVKFGISIKAVVEALKEAVKYKVERFTGMIVDTMDVFVMNVKQ